MLQYSTIEPATLELLKSIMAIKELQQFNLVGGTALALRYGHRLSIDLDLFSQTDFSNEEVIRILENNFPTFNYRSSNNPIGVLGFINEVKVDFVKHFQYPMIDDVQVIDGVRIVSDKDIIAMKINAILRRAVKKDFWDMAELLQHYSVKDCIDFYQQKCANQQLFISIPQAITYFEDAEESEDPVSLKGQTWEGVKSSIQKAVRAYLS